MLPLNATARTARSRAQSGGRGAVVESQRTPAVAMFFSRGSQGGAVEVSVA